MEFAQPLESYDVVAEAEAIVAAKLDVVPFPSLSFSNLTAQAIVLLGRRDQLDDPRVLADTMLRVLRRLGGYIGAGRDNVPWDS